MTFEEYEREGRLAFAELAQTVAAILRAAILHEPGFRLQQIKERAKAPDSLRNKLAARVDRHGQPLTTTAELETEIKDLAGCRVIFYTNSDVTKLIRSGIIEQNFEVLETKLHHPRREIEDASELYVSNHYLVRLRPERVALPEYARFAGMRCEVQIQTILNHAWAEMAHDTIYKQPELGEFGGRALEAIKKRMTKVARRYLLPAGYEFAKISSDFQRLIDGKALFDGDALDAIVNAADNNARADALTTFAESVLPLYDDPQSEYAEIVEKLLQAVAIARRTQAVPIETPYGALPAKTAADIVQDVAELIKNYRYLDVDVSFDALCELYGTAEGEKERKRLLALAEHLAKHNIHVWRQNGPIVQGMLVECIARLDDDHRRTLAPVVNEILSEILMVEVSGTTNNSSSVTFHSGAVAVSDALTAIREKAIELLKNQFSLSQSDEERGEVLASLQSATRVPISVGYGDDLAGLIMADAYTVIAFQSEIAAGLSFELLQKTESRVHRLYRNHHVLPEWMNANPVLVTLRDRFADAALQFRDTINADEEFCVYKTLVGFESIFTPAWETDDFDYTEERAHREGLVEGMLATVSTDSAKIWFRRIQRCAQTESSDMATFPVFADFLDRLGRVHPAIMLGYIDRVEEPLVRFLPAMIAGVLNSDRAADGLTRLREWIVEGQYLDHIAWYLRFADPFDEELLLSVLDRAEAMGDRTTIRVVLSAAVLQYPRHPGNLIEGGFLRAVRLMHAANDLSWMAMPWFSWLRSDIILALDEGQAKTVLDALLRFPDIEHGAEHVAGAIAKKWPALVMRFFGERLLVDDEEGKPERYDAIPFSVYELKRPLNAAPDTVLSETRRWFDRSPRFFEFHGGRLLASIFPDLSDGFADRLAAVIQGGKRDDLAFVLAVLNAFDGTPVIFPLVRAIVAQLEPADELLRIASLALNQSGVISGQFGFAELYAERKQMLTLWMDDENERVRDFARSEIRDLDAQIAAEYRSAEASIATRKLNFDEDADDDGAV